MLPVEAALGMVSIFAGLRPDELGRIASRVDLLSLEAGESHIMDATVESARLVIVVSGALDGFLDDPAGSVHERMLPGDRYGEAMLLSKQPKVVSLRAIRRSVIALISAESFTAILAEFPAVALPLAAELASELRARNDQVRQVLTWANSGLPRTQIEFETRKLKRSLVARSVGLRRRTARGLFRKLVVERGNEPPFWMLIGFILGLSGARLVVYLIIKYHLETQLYALMAGGGANPMHIHHFNYGLLIVAMVGTAALSSWARRPLRLLSFCFGLGCALTFDEFALFWNLSPDYHQGLSVISAAIVAVILIQVAYFREFWLALFIRVLQGARSE
ncbi:MAG TPA: cyclic nucleotide-binding domain-containing protein [Polyangiaceae bacterium]